MPEIPDYMTPERWLQSLFSAQAVNRGGLVHRKVRDVERYVGLEAFQAEVARRGFQLIENNGIYIVLCNAARARMVVKADPSMDRTRSVDRSVAPCGNEEDRHVARRSLKMSKSINGFSPIR